MPEGGLLVDSHGNLYGTTSGGGLGGFGTVFEYNAQSGQLNVLASFDGTNGKEPTSGLIMDSRGNLYGTTGRGRDV